MAKKILISLLLLSYTLNAQTAFERNREQINNITEPNILLSLAWSNFENRRLGDALIFAQRAWQYNGSRFSEASYLMGLIYRAQNELTLAERHLERAIDEDSTYLLRTKYLYALAELYLMREEYGLYLAVLTDIERRDFDDYNFTTLRRQREQAGQILMREGLNRVIELYRWEVNPSLLAVEMQALAFYRMGSPAEAMQAIENFLYAMVVKSSMLISHLQFYRPSYRFTGLEELLDMALSYHEMHQYLIESDFFRSYYFLALSLAAVGEVGQSRVLLNRIRLRPEAGQWQIRAESQFRQPFFDEYGFYESFERDFALILAGRR
ncbi:MAG: hypothetical protein FWE37_06575 [Spirochaetaceae bacterium]|nr:hypothetical protein [Spirochaetaceae bacterium]